MENASSRGMRTLRVPAFCFLLSACSTIAVPTTGGPATTSPPSTSGTAVEADIIRYTNQQRIANGLPAFATSAKLVEAARIHARQMAEHQRMDHTINAAPYPTLLSRLQAVSYAYANAAENVAWNNQSAQSVVTGWMNSAGHRANILNPNLREMGAAMARSAKGEPYWIQVFGTPR
jgi:uncharacterized protein YkwD